MGELQQYASEMKKSVDKDAFLFILKERRSEIREELEDISLGQDKTNALRGGILEIRCLIDLFEK